jgi:hypothetical protein
MRCLCRKDSKIKVQLRSLVEHPQLYEGKVVVVDGFFAFGKEGDAICNELREDVPAFLLTCDPYHPY